MTSTQQVPVRRPAVGPTNTVPIVRHTKIINQNKITNLTHNSFLCMFISILYMFRAAMCPPSGELIVSIRHLVYVTLYR